MKIKFKPLPGLTIATAICLAILISLGTWQYRRLQWKTTVLAQIDEAAIAAPLTSLGQIVALMKEGKPIDFRRIGLHGNFLKPNLNNGAPFHLMKSNGHYFAWRLYQPMSQGKYSVYVATKEFLEPSKLTPPKPITGKVYIAGYVRLVQKGNRFTPKSDPVTNRWFVFNGAPKQLDWAGAGQAVSTIYYLDMVEDIDAAKALPVRKPQIANNHLDYMLTWYSFALILIVIYLLFHKKQGRLRIVRE